MKVLRPRERPPLAPEAKKYDPPRDPLPARRSLGNEFARHDDTRPAGGNILQQMALDEKKDHSLAEQTTQRQPPPRGGMGTDMGSAGSGGGVRSSSSSSLTAEVGGSGSTNNYKTTIAGKMSHRQGASVWDCFQPYPNETEETCRLKEGQGLYAIPTKKRVNQAPANFVPDKGNRAVVEENRYHNEQYQRPGTRYERDLRTQNHLWEILTGTSDTESVDSGKDPSVSSRFSDQMAFVDYKQSNNIYQALHQDPPYSYNPQDPFLKQAAERRARVEDGTYPSSKYFTRYKQKESDKLQEALIHDASKHRAPREDYALPESKRHGSHFRNTPWDAQAPMHLSWDEAGATQSSRGHNGGKSEAQSRLEKHLAGHKWMPSESRPITTECRENYQGKMTGGPRQPAPRKFGKKMVVPNHMNPWGGRTKVV
eukprot:gb/GECG01010434.1/.p1 GENE.gb/GECG01010434.1/~~gb/GECG01010434.1/.p1  ORF type:complete len:425 (+),score=48.70 gb/GECG01010434.1/:1-1275(+)